MTSFLLFLLLLLPLSSYCADGPSYGDTTVDLQLSQEYVISPDVIAQGNMVANQFDGIVDPADLPEGYDQTLIDMQDNAIDKFERDSALMFGSSGDGYGNQFLSDGLYIMRDSTNSGFYKSYGVTNTSFGIGATNFIPSDLPSELSNAFITLGSSPSYTNTHGIFQFGPFTPYQRPYLRVNFSHFKINWQPPASVTYTRMADTVHSLALFIVRFTGWILLVIRAREVVSIFTGSSK